MQDYYTIIEICNWFYLEWFEERFKDKGIWIFLKFLFPLLFSGISTKLVCKPHSLYLPYLLLLEYLILFCVFLVWKSYFLFNVIDLHVNVFVISPSKVFYQSMFFIPKSTYGLISKNRLNFPSLSTNEFFLDLFTGSYSHHCLHMIIHHYRDNHRTLSHQSMPSSITLVLIWLYLELDSQMIALRSMLELLDVVHQMVGLQAFVYLFPILTYAYFFLFFSLFCNRNESNFWVGKLGIYGKSDSLVHFSTMRCSF